jgi:hypothetical protein
VSSRLAIPLAVVLIGAAGCGTHDRRSSKIDAAVQTYFSAIFNRGDFGAACEKLAPGAQRALILAWNAVPTTDVSSCGDAFRRMQSIGSLDRTVGGVVDENRIESAVNAIPRVDVKDVSIHGDRATARVEGSVEPVEFVRIRGDWKIAVLRIRP